MLYFLFMHFTSRIGQKGEISVRGKESLESKERMVQFHLKCRKMEGAWDEGLWKGSKGLWIRYTKSEGRKEEGLQIGRFCDKSEMIAEKIEGESSHYSICLEYQEGIKNTVVEEGRKDGGGDKSFLFSFLTRPKFSFWNAKFCSLLQNPPVQIQAVKILMKPF